MHFLHFFSLLVGFLRVSLTSQVWLVKQLCIKGIKMRVFPKSYWQIITVHQHSGVLFCCLLAGQLWVVTFFVRCLQSCFLFKSTFLGFFSNTQLLLCLSRYLVLSPVFMHSFSARLARLRLWNPLCWVSLDLLKWHPFPGKTPSLIDVFQSFCMKKNTVHLFLDFFSTEGIKNYHGRVVQI